MRNNITLEWSKDAQATFNGILKYYRDKDRAKGRRYLKEIRQQAKYLKQHPFLGLQTSKKGVRRLLVVRTPYFLPYKLLPNEEHPETVFIVQVISSFEESKAQKYR